MKIYRTCSEKLVEFNLFTAVSQDFEKIRTGTGTYVSGNSTGNGTYLGSGTVRYLRYVGKEKVPLLPSISH